MPTTYETARLKMNAAVDRHLGDTIRLKRAGESGYRDVIGFVLEVDPPFGSDELDPLPQRRRIKIAKAVLDRPQETDRFQHKALGEGTFMPGVDVDTAHGDYWIFDVQEV